MKLGRLAKIGIGIAVMLAVLGGVVFKFSPFIGTYFRDDPTPLGFVKPDSAAPDFAVQGSDGKTYRLSDFRGKTVVLEWTSPICEFTANHYKSGTMQALQKKATDKGVIWLLIDSSEVGAPDYLDAAAANQRMTSLKTSATAWLIDSDGRIGLTYGALTTPFMYVIDPTGKLRYQGAVDDNPWGKGTLDVAHNYVLQALASIEAGMPVQTPQTRSYGCSVKYGAGRRKGF